MKCRLCLEMAPEAIAIFGETGEELGVASILTKHFWFSPVEDDSISTEVCCSCWEKVFDFHKFYEQVEEAHRSLGEESPFKAEENDVKVFLDPENTIMLPEFHCEMKLQDAKCDESLMIDLENVKLNEKDLFEGLEDSTLETVRRSKRSSAKPLLPTTTKKRGRPKSKGKTEETPVVPMDKALSPDLALKGVQGIGSATESPEEGENANEEKDEVTVIANMTVSLTEMLGTPKKRGRPKSKGKKEEPPAVPADLPCKDIPRIEDATESPEEREYEDEMMDAAADEGNTSDSLPEMLDIPPKSPLQAPRVKRRRRFVSRNPSAIPKRTKDHNSEETAGNDKSFHEKSRERDEMIAKVLRLYCEICGEEQENFRNLKKHMETVHGTAVYAVCCNRRFTKRCYLLEHIKHHIDPDRFRCKECNKVCSDENTLQTHILSKHQSYEERAFQCPKCSKKFATASLMEKHLVLHEERVHKCEHCSSRFPSMYLLNWHVKVIHDKFGIMCEICAKVLRGRAAFERHQLEHAGVTLPKVQCDICGAWLKDKRSLKRHKITHNEAGIEYKCTDCGKLCSNHSALVDHRRYVHTAELAHVCTVCSKGFKKSCYLKEHMATHTGQGLYTCTFCPRTFNSKANMYSHRKKMHPAEYEDDLRKRNERKFSNPSKTSSSEASQIADSTFVN